MFNMQSGVLPFEATTWSFAASLCVVVLAYIIIYKLYFYADWEAWAAAILSTFRDALAADHKRRNGKPANNQPPSAALAELPSTSRAAAVEMLQGLGQERKRNFSWYRTPRSPILDEENRPS